MWLRRAGALVQCVRRVALSLCWAAALGACGSTIASVNDPTAARFIVGSTRKSDVLEALGLPALSKVERGHEYWGYTDGPTVVSVTVPTHVSGNHATLSTFEWDNELRAHRVYVFSGDGVLVSVQGPR